MATDYQKWAAAIEQRLGNRERFFAPQSPVQHGNIEAAALHCLQRRRQIGDMADDNAAEIGQSLSDTAPQGGMILNNQNAHVSTGRNYGPLL